MLRPAECDGAATVVKRDIAVIVGWFALLSAAYWAAVLIVSGQVGFPLDDSFIHLQFARNLYEDGQMTFNEGIRSSGSTAPLWPVLIAAAYPLLGNWYLTSLILGALCTLASALAVYGITWSWTGRLDLARWAGLLTIFISPTLVQAYTGMESVVYSLCFLIGLWAYGAPRRRLLGSTVFALCVWLRPEFLLMLPFICLERAVAARRTDRRCLTTFFAEVWPHCLIWAVMIAAYVLYNWHQDGHFVPSTLAAKTVAPVSLHRPWFESLPAAFARGNLFYIFLSIAVWPTLLLFLASVGLTMNCAPLGFGLREAVLSQWRDDGRAAAARRLAVITLIGYPWLRGYVDPSGVMFFQFQRYYAHLTPLLVLVVIGALPTTGAVLKRPFWNWDGMTLGFQQGRTLRWAAASCLVTGALGVMSVTNINSMQVSLGQWVREHTTEDQLVATNDIGAIGFISRRPVLDTVGLIEPEIVKHYMQGGDLLAYLHKKKPAYVIAFPWWFPEIEERPDVLEPIHSVTLRCNVICGGSTMVVYRPKWEQAVGM